MERSRSKRSYHYEQYSPLPPPRTKTRYDGGGGCHHHHRRGGDRRTPHYPSSSKRRDSSPHSGASVTTSFRILCPNAMAGYLIDKSRGIINKFREDTGAWIYVHKPVPGDSVRIIETSDSQRRGRLPHYSPAQEALLLIHDWILDAECCNQVKTMLVLLRGYGRCLLGMGGKIMEQMKIETKAHIKILPP